MPLTIDVSVDTRSGFTVSSGLFVTFKITLNKLEGFVEIHYYKSQSDYDSGKGRLLMPSNYPETLSRTITSLQYQNDNIINQIEGAAITQIEAIVGASNTTKVNYT